MKQILLIALVTACLAGCSRKSDAPKSETHQVESAQPPPPVQEKVEPIKERKFEGSAFIVAKDGSAHKLALMEVKFIAEDQIEQFIESNTNKIKEVLLERQNVVKRAEQDRRQSLVDYHKLKDSLSKYQNDLEINLERDLAKIHQDLVLKLIKNGASSEKLEKVESEWKAEKEKRAKEREDKRREQEAKDRQFQQELEDRDKAQAAADLGGIDGKFRETVLAFGDVIDTNVFASLPASFTTTKTDADGKFSISVPVDKQCVLAARTQRQVGERVEIYHWLIRLRSVNASPLFLSNDNLFIAKSSESVAELLPLDLAVKSEN